MQQLESDLDVTQEKLMNANQRLSIVVSHPLKRILRSQKRGCSPPHKSSIWQQQPVTIPNVCAKYLKTKPCQMKPVWNPSRTNSRMPES